MIAHEIVGEVIRLVEIFVSGIMHVVQWLPWLSDNAYSLDPSQDEALFLDVASIRRRLFIHNIATHFDCTSTRYSSKTFINEQDLLKNGDDDDPSSWTPQPPPTPPSSKSTSNSLIEVWTKWMGPN